LFSKIADGVDADAGPKKVSEFKALGISKSRSLETLTLEFDSTCVSDSDVAAFSSFFLSRNALPPCRRSNPLMDFAKLDCTPGDAGVNE